MIKGIKLLLAFFVLLSWSGSAKATETPERLDLLASSLIQDIESLTAELRQGGGLRPETEMAIQSWLNWAWTNVHTVNSKFYIYKTTDTLRGKKLDLEKLISVRRGVLDPTGLIEGEEDILSYEDLHNLHVINGTILSGSQPTEKGYRYLKKKGVTIVINWRVEDDRERRMVEDLGLKYYYIPIPPAHPPNEEQVKRFLQIVEGVQNEGGKLYHHCLHGVGRCFTANAAYLISRGMSAEEAISEGKNLANCWPAEQEEKLKEQGIQLGASGLNSFTPQFDFLRDFELAWSHMTLK